MAAVEIKMSAQAKWFLNAFSEINNPESYDAIGGTAIEPLDGSYGSDIMMPWKKKIIKVDIDELDEGIFTAPEDGTYTFSNNSGVTIAELSREITPC